MEKYELTLKNKKLKSYHLISWLLIFLNMIAQFLFAWSEGSRTTMFTVLAILISFLILFFFARGDKFKLTGVYVVMIILWYMLHIYGAIAANIFFYLLYLIAVRNLKVDVQQEEIMYPSFPKRKILWNELENILLKDGILTIDFKNNKLMQNEIEQNDDLNERDFNEFCKEQLSK